MDLVTTQLNSEITASEAGMMLNKAEGKMEE